MLCPAAHAALTDAERILHQSSAEEMLPGGLASLHSRFGTPARAIDMTVIAMILVIVATGGRVAWLARVYGFVIAVIVVLTVAALVRIRPTPITARPPVQDTREPASQGPRAAPGTRLNGCHRRGQRPGHDCRRRRGGHRLRCLHSRRGAVADMGQNSTQSRPSAALMSGHVRPVALRQISLDYVDARPGNVLVPVRNPHALAHVVGVLQTPSDRDVVVMTVRLIDVDVTEEAVGQSTPTRDQRRLLSDVVAALRAHRSSSPPADRSGS